MTENVHRHEMRSVNLKLKIIWLCGSRRQRLDMDPQGNPLSRIPSEKKSFFGNRFSLHCKGEIVIIQALVLCLYRLVLIEVFISNSLIYIRDSKE